VNDRTRVEGVDPINEIEQGSLPNRSRGVRPGLVMRVRGRTVKLRGLRAQPVGVWRWLAILGPGLIAGAVSNDAGSIATYSQAGALFGYDLLWVIVFITVSLAVVQEMSARLGAATGRGLLELIRERFGVGWAMLAVIVVGIANFGLIMGEFVGIGAAAELFGVSKVLAVPAAAILVWLLVVVGSYDRVEKVFMAMAAVFLVYPVAAILSHPNLGQVAQGAVVPRLRMDAAYLGLLVGVIGTTMSPYQQVFQASATVEKGVARKRYGPERWDTYIGMVLSNLISAFIIIATAATLHVAGKAAITSAADAAKALEPVAGHAAGALFGIGLLGASLMAAGVLPMASAYTVTEAFGLPKGISLTIHRAPVFFGLFSVALALGAALSLIPNLPIFQFLVWVQILNGALLPVILVFILLLINDRQLMGDLKNSRVYNVLGWITAGLVSVAVAFLLLQQILGLFGINLLPAG
jgi:NRAMP (natural resistance-associated macrophage protein)-like metal ion transporter